MPLTNVTTAITAATPITTPSMVSAERSLFAHNDRNAILMASVIFIFFVNDAATTEIYPLSLHDALPIFRATVGLQPRFGPERVFDTPLAELLISGRSAEHTSELQSLAYLVCRLLLA